MKQSRGIKRSSQKTFKRRLVLVRLLLQGPRYKLDLIGQVQSLLEDEGYPADASDALKHDLDALKRDFDCNIRYHRPTGRYELASLGQLTLFNLSDEALEALGFLEANFPAGDALPEHANIRTFLYEVRRMLPPERQTRLQPDRVIQLDRASLGENRISATVMRKLRGALWRQEIEFQYVSNQPGNPWIRHRAAPYSIRVGTAGHLYLEAATLEVENPDPTISLPKLTQYRIDRIVPETLKILSRIIPPQKLGVRRYAIKYWLHPNVARRRDMATHFPDSQVLYNDDESAIVTATATDLWQARQTLLRYGSACVVLEPAELVALFRKTIMEMAGNYRLTCHE